MRAHLLRGLCWWFWGCLLFFALGFAWTHCIDTWYVLAFGFLPMVFVRHPIFIRRASFSFVLVENQLEEPACLTSSVKFVYFLSICFRAIIEDIWYCMFFLGGNELLQHQASKIGVHVVTYFFSLWNSRLRFIVLSIYNAWFYSLTIDLVWISIVVLSLSSHRISLLYILVVV